MVSSFPIPTPSPGLKRVPRWRTMISPPVTVCPANTFTPRRLECESRPLRDEPNPFLCAILCLLLRFLLGRRGRLGRRPSGVSRLAPPAAPAPAGQLDPHDLNSGQLLTVARPALVPTLGLELDHPELGSALVAHHAGLHLN